MGAEFGGIADIPDVIADAILLSIRPAELLASDLLAELNSLEPRAVAVATTADVIDLTGAWREIDLMERRYQVSAMNVVTYLLALIAVDRVWRPGDDALQEIGEEAV